MSLMALLERVGTAADRAADGAATALVAVFTVVVLAGVFFRYVVGAPLTWTDEVARFTMVWMTFLAAAVVLRRGEHVAVDSLAHFLAPRPRLASALRLLVHLIIAWLLVVLLIEGVRLVQTVALQRTPTLGISQSWPFLAVPVGAGLMLLQVVLIILRDAARILRPGAGETGPGA